MGKSSKIITVYELATPYAIKSWMAGHVASKQ
jgi:hypothetical protein